MTPDIYHWHLARDFLPVTVPVVAMQYTEYRELPVIVYIRVFFVVQPFV